MSNNSSVASSHSSSSSHDSTWLLYVFVGASVVLVALVLACVCYSMRRASKASVDLVALDPPENEVPSMEIRLQKYFLHGHLKAKKHIASGTHCVVFRATYEEQDVALKTPLASLLKRADHAEIMEAFATEILLCARLQHQHIIGFVGVVFKSMQNITLVTEFMELGNVATLLSLEDSAKYKWLSTKKAPVTKLSWALGVAQALAYMHGMDLTHRGLKAKNVLLTTNLSVKLSDMGLTRDKEVELSLANTHSRTAGNIAPELIVHAAPFSPAADMYAFGAFLCELDTCKPPFSNLEAGSGGLDNTQIALLVGQGKMQPKFSYSCPDPILALATACMDARPPKRPTALTVVQQLKQIQATL
ncbi:hypothetical protein LEN26_020685 [Aphanomyces euteiches]|nr:hypothetical protein LEN26_020685 [Aphanomyces euteiches]KAH9105958.1 hypothetical protein AeMF1_018337 [Aphanomyces euteiches]KAH9184281.1 hypothetical protein AeNC1_013743 [Aphanomyces euteiches]